MWKYLFGYFPWDATHEERGRLAEQKRLEYQTYKRQWQSITPEQAAHFFKFRDRKSRIGAS